MKSKLLILFITALGLQACKSNNTQIADGTFIHGDKIYKIIDNEVREIDDLSGTEIKKFEALKPKKRDFGNFDMSYVKKGATAKLVTLYRGNLLYYNLQIEGLNDIRKNYYYTGILILKFIDENGFILHSTQIAITDLTSQIDSSGQVTSLTYSGKTEMSTEINSAISKYDLASSLKQIK